MKRQPVAGDGKIAASEAGGDGVASEAAGDGAASDFVRDLVRADVTAQIDGGRVQTRFPPEPNGYLHIGHAKSICLNFGVAAEFGGTCNLRFDDTNPEKESDEFVAAIERDVEWLGFDSARGSLFASDYFETLYELAVQLIGQGLAYVDDQDAATISDKRGDFTNPGVNSPYRERSIEENLDLFSRMRAGEFGDGERVLRAKIDMAHPNMVMRDPLMYRIRHAHHHRTGDRWCIYPNYDWAHGQSDAIEGVTHSLCTLEFENNRELYDWFLDHLLPDPDGTDSGLGDSGPGRPRQTEFGRLGLTYVITSKRKLAALVADGTVEGWDDAQMPTLSGLRRRGFPASSIRDFCSHISVGRSSGTTEIELLESFVRTELNQRAQRRMAVLNPLKLVITNWPASDAGPVVEMRSAINNPEDESAGSREIPFSGELWIERDDFMIDPPKKFFRLSPGREVRLRAGYFVTCTDVITNESGQVTEVHATYDPATAGGQSPDGRKVKATLHWVSVAHAIDAEVRLYERLFTDPHPGSTTGDPLDDLNPNSMTIAHACLEPSLADTPLGEVVQFERLGYFSHDLDRPMLFHRTVGLRDEWARIQKRT